MRFEGYFNNNRPENVNQEILKLHGKLDNDVAKESLAAFLRNNLNFTVELMTGNTLFPFQEMMIRGMFQKDFFMAIAGRAISKSWSAAMFCWLYALFTPGANIGIISASFRQSRQLFGYIEKFAFSKDGAMLSECFNGAPAHRADAWSIDIGKSKITALPLGVGDKLRGFRFNVMVLDELLLIPENIINEVILPFLAANSDPIVRTKVYNEETNLIRAGQMTEEERTKFSNNKFVGLSSASYKFEFLYKLYKKYVDNIYETNPKDENGKFRDTSTYGVMQFSHEIAPKFLYNEDNINTFRNQMSEVQFNREFNSIFTDDSGGFFSKRKMDLCTIPNGESPTIEIVDDKKSKYILAIDPSWSKAEASDHFAMTVLKIDNENKHGIVVHNYAVAGGQFQDHLNYLTYLLKAFNIVYIVIDASGSWFLEDCNASTVFALNKLKVLTFNHDFDNINYMEGVRKSKYDYSLAERKICQAQWFSSSWLKLANERLAACFDHRSIKFASAAMDKKFEELMHLDLDIEHLIYDQESKSLKDTAKKADFIDHQAEMINLVKSETALIEVKSTDNGTLTFTLPQSIKRDTSPTRSRRDSYTALLLGCWGLKCYFDMMDEPDEDAGFIPFFLD